MVEQGHKTGLRIALCAAYFLFLHSLWVSYALAANPTLDNNPAWNVALCSAAGNSLPQEESHEGLIPPCCTTLCSLSGTVPLLTAATHAEKNAFFGILSPILKPQPSVVLQSKRGDPVHPQAPPVFWEIISYS